jgi:glycosyltransferase involved in cell wall biosynthesis
VLTEHGLYLRERYLSYLEGPGTYPVKTLLLSFLRLLSSAVYSEASVIRPASDFNQRWQIRNGAEPERIDTIYNGIDVTAFPVDATEPSVPTISWLGRIDPLKDLETLIRAFGIVRQALPDSRLRLFGTAPAGNESYLATCRSLVDKLGLRAAVTFEGRVADPADAYRAGNVVVLSSISEGFPYTLIEAMASGKATVATRVGGVREAVGDAGLVVMPRDHQAMAKACLRLLADPDLRRQLGARARERIIARFTLKQCLDAYRALYRAQGSLTRAARLQEEEVRRPLTVSWRMT